MTDFVKFSSKIWRSKLLTYLLGILWLQDLALERKKTLALCPAGAVAGRLSELAPKFPLLLIISLTGGPAL